MTDFQHQSVPRQKEREVESEKERETSRDTKTDIERYSEIGIERGPCTQQPAPDSPTPLLSRVAAIADMSMSRLPSLLTV